MLESSDSTDITWKMDNQKSRNNATTKNIINVDAFKRLNFLYQAAHLILPLQPNLARYYLYSMKNISKRLVLRLDPQVKNCVCRYCYLLLIPGETETIRINECRESHLTFTCNDCKRRRRLRIKSKKRKEMTQDMILTSLEAPKTNTLLSQIEKES